MAKGIKLQFKQQDYQSDATQAVVDCFAGQTKGHRKEITERTELLVHEIFANKKFDLSENELTKNVQALQKEQGLNTSKQLETLDDAPNFSIEMETGTGKTYVYTKSMFELNKKYGWSKFIMALCES